MGNQTFETRFCARFHCAPSEYRERAFTLFLYRHARLVAPIIRAVKPEFFDLNLTTSQPHVHRALGAATDLIDAINDLMDFSDSTHRHPTWLRVALRLRVSGRR